MRAVGDHEAYDVRPFESGDRAGYLSLYGTVLGTPSEEWFVWKYEQNPYTDHVPILVATHDEQIVGAKSMLGMQLRRGDSTLSALQPCDTMVHPDHRRRGLYSRMTELSKDIYADRDVDLFFNFPNRKTLAGGLKHGWERVGQVPTYYRVQNPVKYARVDGGLTGTIAEKLSVPVLRGYYALKERLVSPSTTFSVEQYSTVPVAKLEALYKRAIPGRIHTVRDERYYDWRFDSPKWEYETYLARQNGTVMAAVVVGTPTTGGESAVHLTEVLPLGGGTRPSAAFEAILMRVLEEYPNSEVIAVAGDSLPERVCREFGFRPDTDPPLNYVTTPATLIAHLLGPDGSPDENQGTGATSLSNWCITFTDMDTR